ncbi:MAG: GNAT family N-acetyltransferase [Anaerolineae bacterium]|nr:GNAT family N-acetyltransferase [Anaerolineae bacterium]
MERLDTERLTLIPMTDSARWALLHGQSWLSGVPGSFASGWPAPDLLGLLEHHPAQPDEDGDRAGWEPWLLIHREDAALVGDAGFHAPPDGRGEVEIGYSVAVGYRGRGLATEAVLALVRWALDRGATAVVARSDAGNLASARVLTKAGFYQTGQVGDEIAWRFQPAPKDHA